MVKGDGNVGEERGGIGGIEGSGTGGVEDAKVAVEGDGCIAGGWGWGWGWGVNGTSVDGEERTMGLASWGARGLDRPDGAVEGWDGGAGGDGAAGGSWTVAEDVSPMKPDSVTWGRFISDSRL